MQTSYLAKPTIIGVVNITEDSFSDGGLYLDPTPALQHALQLLKDGADVVELGAASSHPDSKTVTTKEEINRLIPVLKVLVANNVSVSVDSCNSEVQKVALQNGAKFINDIAGFADQSLYPFLAKSDLQLIVMHNITKGQRANRVDTDETTIWNKVESFFDDRIAELEHAGIKRDRLILDPGLGFFLGSTNGPSLIVLREIKRLIERYDLPVMTAASRKSFIQRIVKKPALETGAATLTTEIWSALMGVQYIRTHDPASLSDGLKVLSALRNLDR